MENIDSFSGRTAHDDQLKQLIGAIKTHKHKNNGREGTCLQKQLRKMQTTELQEYSGKYGCRHTVWWTKTLGPQKCETLKNTNNG